AISRTASMRIIDYVGYTIESKLICAEQKDQVKSHIYFLSVYKVFLVGIAFACSRLRRTLAQ
ncbi:MAG: hypothetical protein AAFQ87_17515, partial [Bacteroidota bacterium]